MIVNISSNSIHLDKLLQLRAGPRDAVAGGGGALKAKVLNRAAKAARGGRV